MVKKKVPSKEVPKEEVIRGFSELTPDTKQKVAKSFKKIITELDEE
jgi:hypothetical protein